MPSALLLLVRTWEKRREGNRLSLLGKGNYYTTSSYTQTHTQNAGLILERSEADHAHYLFGEGWYSIPPTIHVTGNFPEAGLALHLLSLSNLPAMAPSAYHLFSMERRALSADQNVLMTHLVVWLLSLVSGILLALRLFTKWLRAQQLWSDDGFLIASWVSHTCPFPWYTSKTNKQKVKTNNKQKFKVVIIFYSAITSLELALGTGRRPTAPRPAGPSPLLLLDNVARSLALTAAAWSKTSLACTLLRLQSPRLVRAALYSVLVFVNMVLAGAAIAHWLRCRPIAAGWGSGEGACWSINIQNIVGLSAQSFSAAMDLALVVVVWQVLWTKGLSVAEKVGVGALMALGVL